MKPILNDTDSFFYMMEDGVTGVFAHTTFMPTPPSPDQEANVTRKWVQNIAKGLQALENAGARRLVLDLSGNGGGLVAYGWHLMNYLFPHGNLKPLEYAFPLTPEINRIFENTTVAAKFFNGYRNLHGALIQNLTMELAAPGTKLIKGLSTPFTNHFLMDFDLTLKKSNMSTFSDFGSLKRAWDPKNVILLSNGLCGSTCAQFTTILRDQLRVRSVTYGGGNKRSKKGTRAFDGTSFAAGFIKKIIDIMILLSSTESEGLVDPPFWFNIDSQITFATSFSKAGKLPEVPIEWVVDTSDFWLNSSDLTLDNPESVYKAVLDAKIFSSEHGSTRTKAFRKVKSNKKQAWHRHHHAVDARNGKGVGH
ncbi:hypothetical protein BC830DRAFT_287532 [Chytriomyces sp. MP71]|nr:hypothetical protein BC830DRAFT_287532 [Chytriomyces sp. MP71]